MEQELSIRKANDADAVLISVLASTTFYEAYFEQDESRNLARYIHESFDVGTVLAELADPNTTFHIIFVNGMAAGYARMIAESIGDGVTGERVVEVRRFYIVERYWRGGVGTHLLEHCINEAKRQSFEVIWLAAWEQNARAQAFYAKFGFRHVGMQTFPYGDVVGINKVLELPLN